MKPKLLFLFLILSSFISYSQEFDEIKIDYKLQKKYADTLKIIGEKLTGNWKYLGENNSGILIDTLSAIFGNGKETYEIVENGIAYELTDGKKKKTNYFYRVSYSFKNEKGNYFFNQVYFNKDITEFRSCQPVPELVYYNNKFGILFTTMDGLDFDPIIKLDSEKLIFENGKEYLKIK